MSPHACVTGRERPAHTFAASRVIRGNSFMSDHRSILRRCVQRCAAFVLLAVLAWPALAQHARDGFSTQVDQAVRALLQQADGRLLLGGDFTQVEGSAHGYLARVRADGSLDAGFDAALDGVVTGLVAQADGSVLVSGGFTHAGATAQAYLARLSADGAIDTQFRPALDGDVSAVAVQADGKIVLGGSFEHVGATASEYLARLNADGSLDATFAAPALDAPVDRITVQADGKILLGGNFSSVGGAEHLGLVRLHVDGSVDATFAAPPTGPVGGIVVQPDARIVVGGVFFPGGGAPMRNIVRLNADGSLDGSFTANVDGALTGISMQADGELLISGLFNTVGGLQRRNAARLHVDGSVDAGFDPQPGNEVYALLEQYDGKLVLGGAFRSVRGQTHKYLVRLNADGSPDVDFIAGGDPIYPGVIGDIRTVATQADGKILIGGSLDFVGSVGGGRSTALVRLNADGSPDAAFHVPVFGVAANPTAGTFVYSVSIRPDGRLLIGGSFDLIDGQVRTGLALLEADGTLVADFAHELIGAFSEVGMVYGIRQEADGALLISGRFETIDGVRRVGIARLRGDGSVDPAFATGDLVNVGIYGTAVLPDGRVLTNGWQGVDYDNQLRLLNADGSMDTTFWPLMDDRIASFALQGDGRILVSGLFTQINSSPARYFARLLADGTRDTGFSAAVLDDIMDTFAEQLDGSLLIAGRFGSVNGQPRHLMARLDRSGVVDPGYAPDIGLIGSTGGELHVAGLVTQTDGKTLVYGEFTGADGMERTNIARLSTPQAAVQHLDVGSDGSIRWLRSGAGSVLSRVAFEWSDDRQQWHALGAGHVIDGGWGIDGAPLPHGRNLWVRALGYPPHTPAIWSSMASESVQASVRRIYLSGATSFLVAPRAGAGGRIDPATDQIVEQGATPTFTLTPDAGYRLAEVSGCGGRLDGTQYVVAPVAADCQVDARFERDTSDRIFRDGFEPAAP